MEGDAFLFRAVVFAIIFMVVHLLFELFSPRTQPLPRLSQSQMLPRVAAAETEEEAEEHEQQDNDDSGDTEADERGGSRHRSRGNRSSQQLLLHQQQRKQRPRQRGTQRRQKVAVTGGAGFLGHAIVRRLQAQGFSVVVVDRAEPPSSRRVEGVAYLTLDLTAGSNAELVRAFRGCAAVCHTAGVVTLTDDFGLVFNAHVVATQRVIRAARLAGVRALVATSSTGAVTSPYVPAARQQNIPSNFQVPADWDPFSHYSRTKYEAERHVLRSNDDGGGGGGKSKFRTLALRMPGIYGVGDTLMVDAVYSGLMRFVPSSDGCCCGRGGGGSKEDRRVPIDFCYVENAAHAHVLAVGKLLSGAPDVAGRTYNVTNGDGVKADTLELWNGFIKRIGAARVRAGGRAPK
jgi:nucleoside-diphosphate-sugar epimerase